MALYLHTPYAFKAPTGSTLLVGMACARTVLDVMCVSTAATQHACPSGNNLTFARHALNKARQVRVNTVRVRTKL